MVNIDDLLGQAYRLDQQAGHRPEAVALIRDAAKDLSVAAVLRQRRDQLRQVREARRFGDRDGCHVTATMVDLLNAALP